MSATQTDHDNGSAYVFRDSVKYDRYIGVQRHGLWSTIKAICSLLEESSPSYQHTVTSLSRRDKATWTPTLLRNTLHSSLSPPPLSLAALLSPSVFREEPSNSQRATLTDAHVIRWDFNECSSNRREPLFEENLTRNCFWHGYCHEHHCRS